MTTQHEAPREPLDLEALERHTKALDKIAQRYGTYAVADVFALLARIRELEAERPDWSDEQVERFVAERRALIEARAEDTFNGIDPSANPTDVDIMRSALRAAGIVPNVARWRPVAEYDGPDGRDVLLQEGRGRYRLGFTFEGKWWLSANHEQRLYPDHFRPLPAPPTTEAT
jgi:hypothetical protein